MVSARRRKRRNRTEWGEQGSLLYIFFPKDEFKAANIPPFITRNRDGTGGNTGPCGIYYKTRARRRPAPRNSANFIGTLGLRHWKMEYRGIFRYKQGDYMENGRSYFSSETERLQWEENSDGKVISSYILLVLFVYFYIVTFCEAPTASCVSSSLYCTMTMTKAFEDLNLQPCSCLVRAPYNSQLMSLL